MMKINPITLPTYKDIFDDDPKCLIASITAIPAQFVTTMCFLNTKFYFTDNHNNLDDYIKDSIFGRALSSTKDGRKVLKWMLSKKNSKILDSYTIQELYVILFSIKNFLPADHIMTIDDELLLLKLVLIANQKRVYQPNRQKLIDDNVDNNNLDDSFFQSIAWSNNLSQIDVNINCNFIFEACRCVVMMKYLYSLDKTRAIIDDFLKSKSVDNIITYSFYYTLIIQNYYLHGKDSEYKIQADSQVSTFMTPLCIHLKPDTSLLDIKRHPVFRLGDFFYILDLNYFTSQIFTGTYFSLKNKIEKKHLINNLKSELGTVMESQFLKPIITNSFKKHASKMKFDCDFSNKGYPDAMLQMGNSIFIFELKDNLLADSAMESLDFDEIKNKTEEIFVQSYEKSKKAPNPKAVVQITNYIKKLLDGDYDNNDLSFRYNQSYYIYPIILFTDYKYNSSGIGYYIRERFFDITKGKKGRINHLVKNGRIKPVTFIGLDFFFNNIYSFSQNKRLLKTLLDEYHLEINKEETLNLKAPAPFDRDLYPSFERYHSKYNYIIPPIANKEIEFFKIFGIIFT